MLNSLDEKSQKVIAEKWRVATLEEMKEKLDARIVSPFARYLRAESGMSEEEAREIAWETVVQAAFNSGEITV